MRVWDMKYDFICLFVSIICLVYSLIEIESSLSQAYILNEDIFF